MDRTTIEELRNRRLVAMTTAGRRAYHSGQPLVEPDVADFGPRVSAAEALIFVYRAGWTGMPRA